MNERPLLAKRACMDPGVDIRATALPMCPDGGSWPKISIVTPSFNQGQFLEETIRSVLLQGYPNLEYIIMDGGSTDNSVEIIKTFEPWLTYWVSEKDGGQSDALDRGFRRCTGDILAYINSDDVYLPYSFELVARLFTEHPDVDWITGHSSFLVDKQVISPRRGHVDCYNKRLMQLGFNVPWLLGIPQQVSTFWRRDLYNRAGGFVRKELWHAMDVDLWVRMARFSAPVFLPATVAMMRLHGAQKSANSSAFREVEEVGHRFLALHLRRILLHAMRTPIFRGLLRRTWLPAQGTQFVWDLADGKWIRTTKLAF